MIEELFNNRCEDKKAAKQSFLRLEPVCKNLIFTFFFPRPPTYLEYSFSKVESRYFITFKHSTFYKQDSYTIKKSIIHREFKLFLAVVNKLKNSNIYCQLILSKCLYYD